ncbi:hypothetical protein BpHYR1_047101 [Brachionus plicatilis]|uniref:Uncharacterized protein n=1 Tax=Brachionus plicatilis TaxID=10195 RepID=A0A3M7Q1V8_BRAPC|nr:hypothetical protein BpHYR1_047101 [Brachionus plicatilis]
MNLILFVILWIGITRANTDFKNLLKISKIQMNIQLILFAVYKITGLVNSKFVKNHNRLMRFPYNQNRILIFLIFTSILENDLQKLYNLAGKCMSLERWNKMLAYIHAPPRSPDLKPI